MFKGTTPTHTFNLPFDSSLIKEIRIIYSQKGKVVLKKATDECTIEGITVKTKLSQEDTFQFKGNVPVSIILRVLTQGNDAIRSLPIVRSVAELCDDEVLV
jgi:hypothetical protein